MSKYRINVRFDLDNPKEAKAAQYLQSLDKSRNAFMVTAILNEMQRQTSVNGFLLPEKRKGGLCYGTQNHAEAADKNQRPCAQSLL